MPRMGGSACGPEQGGATYGQGGQYNSSPMIPKREGEGDRWCLALL